MRSIRRISLYLFAILGICDRAMMNQDLLQELAHMGVNIDTDTSKFTVGLNNSGLNACRFAVSTTRSPFPIHLSLK